MKMSKVSQYELEREANIARNRALLEELELKQAVTDLGIIKDKGDTKKSKAKPIQSSKRGKKQNDVPVGPLRQSSRLKRANVEPNESPAKRRKREEEERAKEAEARLLAEEEARIAKLPRTQDLVLATLASDEEEKDVNKLSDFLKAISDTSRPKRVGDPDAFVFEGKGEEKVVAELQERLQALEIVSRAKVTQDRVYSSAFHPEVTKDLIFFGDKHGQLGIWDASAPRDALEDDEDENTSSEQGGRYWRLQAHWPATSKSSLSCIRFDPTNSHNVYTSSYDCTVRVMSFETGISRQIYSSGDNLISTIDLPSSGNEIWISDASGGIAHLDLREPGEKQRRYELSDQKIGCLSLNPVQTNYLLTSSNNRRLSIWDIRSFKDVAARLDESTDVEWGTVAEYLDDNPKGSLLRGEWRHDKSVSSAYWDPRGRSVVSTSYDDNIRLWEFKTSLFQTSEPFPSSRPFSKIRHDCQTGKWLTILRAQWSPNPDVYPHFTIGNMKHSLDIFSGKGELLAKLSDSDKISAVQAVTCSHPSIVERAASGNASGRCVLWSIPRDTD